MGLDIGTSAVRAAELSLGKNGAKLEKFGQVALPPGAVRDGEVIDVAIVAAAIKHLWSTTRFSSKKVVLGVANQKVVVRQVDLCLQNAKRARAYDGWNAAWLKFIERNLGAWMHAENGLGLHVFTAVQRSGPTNMINTAVAVNAAHKMRFAQDLALFNLDLSEADVPFDGSAHKEVWKDAAEWQPTREVVERLTAVGDWCELLFATNVVFEQLVGSLFRSELVMQIAAVGIWKVLQVERTAR